jgi:hypothetical protein
MGLQSKIFKGAVSRDYRPLVFFHQTNSPRPLIHGLNLFAYGLEFAKIFDLKIADFALSGVNNTAEAKDDP